MAQPSQIFWDVDTQVDFLSPGGKLYVPGSEAIVPTLQRLTQWAAEHQVLVVASADAHHADDPELRQWSPHCLVGTAGQQKIPETSLPRQIILPNRRTDIPADLSAWQQLVLEKQELDVFTNPNAGPLVAQLGRPDVVLYGVVTELCVERAARNLLQRGCRVTLVEDAVAALDSGEARQCLDGLIEQGGRLASASRIID
ncbi:MAG TPA: isochorismatase family cysteine hydrolase [Acidobacteriaceae bacterium]|nr:isochorismatase family cysteine hydrolase [Acidobacteriaceae bacterium]